MKKLNYTKKNNDKVANMPIIKNLYIDYKNLECTGWISSEIFKDELNLRFNPVTNIDIESKLEKLKKSIKAGVSLQMFCVLLAALDGRLCSFLRRIEPPGLN